MVTDGIAQTTPWLQLFEKVSLFIKVNLSLKRGKDDTKEVKQGFECGLSIENYNDIKEDDVLEFSVMKEVEV